MPFQIDSLHPQTRRHLFGQCGIGLGSLALSPYATRTSVHAFSSEGQASDLSLYGRGSFPTRSV